MVAASAIGGKKTLPGSKQSGIDMLTFVLLCDGLTWAPKMGFSERRCHDATQNNCNSNSYREISLVYSHLYCSFHSRILDD
jgi:hypothetical protein